MFVRIQILAAPPILTLFLFLWLAMCGNINYGQPDGWDQDVIGKAESCKYSLSRMSDGVEARLWEQGQVSVYTETGCAWKAVKSDAWILDPGSGVGNGVFHFQAEVNESPYSRVGTITVGDQVFTLTQNGDRGPLPMSNGVSVGGSILYFASNYPTGSDFYIDVGPGSNQLVAQLTTVSGNPDLSARRDAQPTQTEYDFTSSELGDDTITIPNPAPGRWYFHAFASSAFEYQFRATVSAGPYDSPANGLFAITESNAGEWVNSVNWRYDAGIDQWAYVNEIAPFNEGGTRWWGWTSINDGEYKAVSNFKFDEFSNSWLLMGYSYTNSLWTDRQNVPYSETGNGDLEKQIKKVGGTTGGGADSYHKTGVAQFYTGLYGINRQQFGELINIRKYYYDPRVGSWQFGGSLGEPSETGWIYYPDLVYFGYPSIPLELVPEPIFRATVTLRSDPTRQSLIYEGMGMSNFIFNSVAP